MLLTQQGCPNVPKSLSECFRNVVRMFRNHCPNVSEIRIFLELYFDIIKKEVI